MFRTVPENISDRLFGCGFKRWSTRIGIQQNCGLFDRFVFQTSCNSVGDAVVVKQMALTDKNNDQPIGILLHGLDNAIGHGFVPEYLRFKKSGKAFALARMSAAWISAVWTAAAWTVAFGWVHFGVDLLDSIAVGVGSNLNSGKCGNEATIGEGQTL